ncbi:MAG: endonuclease III [Brevinematales bacterium]|nr:endonuclease III [Brevinematales bacterium]
MIEEIIKILDKESVNWNSPVKEFVKISEKNNFQILVATFLSSRTKDETTIKVLKNLFEFIKTPEDVIKYAHKIERLIYPVGFYKTKAKRLLEIAKILKENYNSKVPDNIKDLISLPGVGRKIANIILYRCYSIPVISVDTHVHRISNRLGFVKTKNPYETEKELEKILDKKWWGRYNEILVAFGQVICKPISPKCDICPVEQLCPKLGVKGRENVYFKRI